MRGLKDQVAIVAGGAAGIGRAIMERLCMEGVRVTFSEIWGRFHMLRRLGTVQKVAGPVAFLLSDEASFITAAELLVDGGYDYRGLNALIFNVGRMICTRDSYESDVILGWHPLFVTISDPASRGLVFFQ
jgi:NADP-dependent 3-hydroxy acid dehydrogenase YdfG